MLMPPGPSTLMFTLVPFFVSLPLYPYPYSCILILTFDLHLQNFWCKFEWICVSESESERGYIMCHCCWFLVFHVQSALSSSPFPHHLCCLSSVWVMHCLQQDSIGLSTGATITLYGTFVIVYASRALALVQKHNRIFFISLICSLSSLSLLEFSYYRYT